MMRRLLLVAALLLAGLQTAFAENWLESSGGLYMPD